MIQIKQALLSIPGAALCEEARQRINSWVNPPTFEDVKEVVGLVENNHIGLSATLAKALLEEIRTKN